MAYKVFLVEDEIMTREGIRDSVDWAGAGFTFCGEAPDGEMALPLIQVARPDVLITDIKMPFMDGLQLCRALKDTLPDLKIIILSGHDEFAYAQEAIQIGVTEYLLKPIRAQRLLEVLRRVRQQIEKERQARENIQRLQEQVNDNLALLREKFLISLVAGDLSTPDALEKCRQWQIDIVARCYLVLLARAEVGGGTAEQAAHRAFQQVDQIIAGLAGGRADLIVFKKDLEETVVILKGDEPARLAATGADLAAQLKAAVESRSPCRLAVGVGQSVDRIGAIALSFYQGLDGTRRVDRLAEQLQGEADAHTADLLRLDAGAVTRFLKSGASADFDTFFADYIRPLGLGDPAPQPLLHYLFTATAVAAANFIREIGGVPERVVPELADVDAWLPGIRTVEHVRERAGQVLRRALDFRDSQTRHQGALIARAKDYIDSHYASPDVSLGAVAAHVNLSPSYFSVVFSREVGASFVEYLTQVRIRKAMELLRTTALTCSEIGYQVGYNNPRYFFAVFKKIAGHSPVEFRRQAQAGRGALIKAD